MSRAWSKVVEDLMNLPKPKKLTTFEKINGFFKGFLSGCCGGNCRQGRNKCDCK